jgi:hypothetical protein
VYQREHLAADEQITNETRMAEATIRRLHYYFKIRGIIENIRRAAETAERRLTGEASQP